MAEPEKVTLPSGGWVLFRDAGDLTERERRPVREAQVRLGAAYQSFSSGSFTSEQIDNLFSVPEAMAIALFDEWSFDTPMTIESLRDLKSRDYDVVMRAARSAEKDLLPNFDDPGDGDPENPTGA